MTIEEKEHRLQVIRSICGSYYKGACDGKCVKCLDRILAPKPEDRK